MAKTTRKTEKAEKTITPAAETTMPVKAEKAAKAKVARTAKVAKSTTAAKAAPRTRTATARTTRKASTVPEMPAMAADRPAPTPAFAEPTHEEIAVRAYHIYLRRHGQPGHPDADWIQAIHELRAERS